MRLIASAVWNEVWVNRRERFVTLIACCAIVLGAALRLSQLPQRALFIDEAITQVRVAGHTTAAVNAALYDGRQRSVAAVRAGAQLDAATSPARVTASLAQEDAQHPPLFYLAELGAVRLLGDSLFAWRLLPALFGILCIPAAYALARELFSDRRVALAAGALVAVSPIERIYSEQVREYSLMTLLVLVTTWAVARAVRTNAWSAWLIYAAAAVAALYTSPITAYVLVAHAVYALVRARDAGAGIALRWCGATAAAAIAYIPWIREMAAHRNDIITENMWSATHWPLSRLAVKWAFNAGSAFFDLEYLDLRWAVVLALVAAIAVFALWRGMREANAPARLLLGAGILVPALLLVLPDLALGEHRSAVARYALPVFIVLPVLLARGLAGRAVPTGIVLAAGACACLVGSLHTAWWDNDLNADDAQIAAAIDRESRAQVVSTVAPALFIPLARLLPDDVRVSLAQNARDAQFTRGEPLFAFAADARERLAFGQRADSAFTAVPYPHAITAHQIGTQMNTGENPEADGGALYRAVRLAGGTLPNEVHTSGVRLEAARR